MDFHFLFMNNASINNVIINQKLYTYQFNPVLFFMLLAVKSLGIFPKHSGYAFISVFCFEMIYFLWY